MALHLLLAAVLVIAPTKQEATLAEFARAVAVTTGSTVHVASTDTAVELRRGDRVVLTNVSGEVSVVAWGEEMLEVRGDHEGAGLVVRRTGATVRVEPDDRKGRRRSIEAALRLPAWVDLEVSGRSLDLSVEGIDGTVDIRTVSGDVWLEDLGGQVRVRTIEGEIDVTRARGGVTASSQSDEVRLRDVSGPVTVHSGSGDVQLMDIRSREVRAETQDGDIRFSGEIRDGGEYGFFTHDGDAYIAIPEGSSARVSVSTFDGDFESDFPVRIERFTGGREFDFLIGDGSARIQIEVFDGEIRLLRR